MMYRIAMRLTTLVLLTALAGCDGGSIFTTSDVPVYEPEAWWSDPTSATFVMRSGVNEEGGSMLVLAHFIHGPGRGIPLYLYDPAAETFEQTPDEAWDEAGEPTVKCSPTFERDTLFSMEHVSISQERLIYDGERVPVAGGNVIWIAPAPTRNLVAVLSTDGSRGSGFFIAANYDSTGQHYGQLFSEEDGSAIGSPVRLGLGGEGSSVKHICWSPDEDIVIYTEDGPHDGGPGKMCFVPVDE